MEGSINRNISVDNKYQITEGNPDWGNFRNSHVDLTKLPNEIQDKIREFDELYGENKGICN